MTTVATIYHFVDGYRASGFRTEDQRVDKKADQLDILKKDLLYFREDLQGFCQTEMAILTRNIATLVAAPLSLIVDLVRSGFSAEVPRGIVLRNFREVPRYAFSSLTSLVGRTLFIIPDKIINGVSAGVGMLVWHGGEYCVKKIELARGSLTKVEAGTTLLSDHSQVRHIVYNSLGLTLLSAGALFVPIPAIRLIALPIVFGSLYGTLNNQFTTRECPEYYTMGHHYDGEHLRIHAVKTYNPTIKSIVTGCYATTMVTKLAGYALAAAGALPYATATVPFAYTVMAVAAGVFLGIAAAHVASRIRKSRVEAFERDMREYARLVCHEIDEEMPAERLKALLLDLELPENLEPEEVARATELKAKITKHAAWIGDGVPLKFQKGWEANSIRNLTGYITAGVGSTILIVATVGLRVFIL